jgi:UDP-glucose 4-epimerase
LLLTGASSGLGKGILPALSADSRVAEVWCAGRRPSSAGGKTRFLSLDLEGPFDLAAIPGPLDLVVHVAGLTHSSDLARYDAVNREGTVNLARAARGMGCRRFAYFSTRCVGPRSGAYGESKKAAEDALRALEWERLLIVRPAEVYGADGSEGIDFFIRLARRFHVVPMLCGDSRVSFAPIHAEDFQTLAAAAILAEREGVETLEAGGPEVLSGVALAWRLARRHGALPIPVFVPALAPLVGLGLFAPDQLARLVGGKSAAASSAPGLRRFPG